jgi:hypothetical protein
METGESLCRSALAPEARTVFGRVAAESGSHLLIPSAEGPVLVLN